LAHGVDKTCSARLGQQCSPLHMVGVSTSGVRLKMKTHRPGLQRLVSQNAKTRPRPWRFVVLAAGLVPVSAGLPRQQAASRLGGSNERLDNPSHHN